MIVTLGRTPYAHLSCRYRRFVLTVCGMVTGVQGAVMRKRGRVAAADGDAPVALVIRLGVAGVVLWNLGQVGRLAYVALTDTPQTIWWQAGALALALPADIVLIVAAIRNVRPRLSGWLLAAVALPVVAVAPLSGYDWALMLTMPAALSLIYFRPPANMAVIIERQRIDDEVASTLGAALGRIVAHGELAQALAESTPDRSAGELEALTARSRDTLAQARAMLSGYREVSAEAELRAAVTLLSAAGIRASLALDSPERLPAELPETARTALRETVAHALEDRGLRECVLTAATVDGELVIGLNRPTDRACREDAA
jgi:signal transduction histidine kinase